MGKKRAFLLGTIILAVLAGVAWEFFRSSEPYYEGRPLSFWLAGFDGVPPRDALPEKAREAVRAVGTNAIPILLRDVQSEDSALKLKMVGLLQDRGFLRNYRTRSQDSMYEAVGGFRSLGAAGSPAVPALIQIYQQSGYFKTQSAVTESLGIIGPGAKDAVPLLVAALNNGSGPRTLTIVIALTQIHSEPDLAVPALMKALSAPDQITRQFAARGLGAFGPDARAAVPALLEMLKLPDSSLRDRAVEALKQIDPEAANKALAGKPELRE